MRIAQVVTYISEDAAFGGPVAVALAQSIELARQGHSLDLYAGWDGRATTTAPGVRLKLFKVDRAHHRALTTIVSIRMLLSLLRARREYDAIQIHFGRDLTSLLAWLVLGRKHSRVVLQPHGMVMPDSRARTKLLDRFFVRRALRSADGILVLTEAEMQGLRAVEPRLESRRLILIHNGIDTAPDVALDRDSARVLFMARLHPRKRVLVFLEAARILINEGTSAQFQIVGPDEGDLPQLLQLIDQHALGPQVQYGGSVPPGDGRAQLANSSVYVLPSVGEVYPMTVLESLAEGTPVVMTQDCGLAAPLVSAGAAVITDEGPQAIADGIRRLLTDDSLRRDLATRGLEYVRFELSIETIAHNLLEVYAAPTRTRSPSLYDSTDDPAVAQ